MKQIVIFILKISAAAGLIWYLVSSGQLDFAAIGKVLTVPALGLSLFVFWLIFQVFLGTYRWRLLLRSCDYVVSYGRALQLQFMGFFFNTAMPGAVGGDLVKAVYVIKENPGKGKTAAMLSVFVDRLVGLGGLFTIGVLVALLNLKRIVNDPLLSVALIGLAATLSGIVLFFVAALYDYKNGDPFESLFSKNLPGFSLLLKIYQSIRTFKNQRRSIALCYLISIAIQFASLFVFYLCSQILLTEQEINFNSIALIFPIGIFTMALPLAPGGLGVGHVAFDKLFEMIGLTGGATVANVYILSLLFLNLLGVIPYLAQKRKLTHDELKVTET